MSAQLQPDRGVLSVLQLTRLVKGVLAETFPAVWVRGEVSNCRRAESGHWYFDLKEGKAALLPCALYQREALRVRFEIRDGMEVEAFGRVDVYEPRGSYQLIVSALRPAGLGALLLELEQLKRRLQAEGLFDAARKRSLPRYPRRVGLVTSPAGAAVRDVVKVLRARWPAIQIVLAPVRVQGAGAAAEIAAAIRRFDRWGRADVLIVGRGGGSLEDLWAFNEEVVVRAIVAARAPVVTAIGHEVDSTLADLAADVRASTPSNAAELVVRDGRDEARRVGHLAARAQRALLGLVVDARRRLTAALEKYGFRRQREAFGVWRQRVDELVERAADTLTAAIARARGRLEHARTSYGLREWPRALARHHQRVALTGDGVTAAAVRVVRQRGGRANALADRLRALSPRRVLERGYCLVRKPDGTFVRIAGDLTPGDAITVEFGRGQADARVEAVREGEEHGGEEA